MAVLKQIGMAILSALMTEAFVKEIIIFLLEKLVKLSDNTVDDELVAKVKEALLKK
jgi:hypothetical protein